jgi:hypothetical protein
MAYRFTTPTISEGPAGEGRLFSRYRLVRGVSVLKIDGVYYELRNPSSEEVASAQAAYIGGYSYEVSAGEKAGLEAAGYTVETI